jgi:hypothetical protein
VASPSELVRSTHIGLAHPASGRPGVACRLGLDAVGRTRDVLGKRRIRDAAATSDVTKERVMAELTEHYGWILGVVALAVLFYIFYLRSPGYLLRRVDRALVAPQGSLQRREAVARVSDLLKRRLLNDTYCRKFGGSAFEQLFERILKNEDLAVATFGSISLTQERHLTVAGFPAPKKGDGEAGCSCSDGG